MLVQQRGRTRMHSVNHLKVLGLEQGASLTEAKKAFKDLSFMLHPDRHPEHLSPVATKMFQGVADAYEYLREHTDQLASPSDHQEQGDSVTDDSAAKSGEAHGNAVSKVDCPRCNGSGEVTVGVDRECRFLYGDCPVCCASGYILADTRNECTQCHGDGRNSQVSKEDVRKYIVTEMGDCSHLSREQSQRRYRRHWVRMSAEHLICRHCDGAGHYYYRSNRRRVRPSEVMAVEQTPFGAFEEERRACS
jgi:DnaJ-class molecular chaperone